MFDIPDLEYTSYEIFPDIGITDNINTARIDAVSIEALDRYDADILFIMDYDRKENSFFLENPVIASLDAVNNNRVYFVNGAFLGVSRMLDDMPADHDRISNSI